MEATPLQDADDRDLVTQLGGAERRLWPLVALRAARTPDLVLLADDRGRAITAAGLRESAEQVAAGLAGLGVRDGTRVTWQLPTSLETLVLAVALARLGAIQNPVITMFREGELISLRDQFRPDVVIAPTRWRGFEHAEVMRRIHGPDVLLLTCDHVDAAPGTLALPDGDPASLPPLPAADSPRWVFTTSGSTSDPKGVLHTDASIIASGNGFLIDDLGMGPDDVYPIAFPSAHIGGMSWLVTSLRAGLRVVMLEKFDPIAGPAAMAAAGATIVGSGVPFFAAYRAAQAAHGDHPFFPRLRLCLGGGSPVPPGTDRALREELGAPLVNGYGLTEFPIAGWPPVGDPAARDISAWRPAPHVEARIVGPMGQDLPDGLEGELRLRGPQRFFGYLRPEDGSGLDEQGFVRTGDLAVRDVQGLITVTGRLKEIVIRNGENISMAEVEGVLAAHQAVADVAVVGLPDGRTGERCCAVVALAPGVVTISLEELAEHCHQAGLARYKIPEQLLIMTSIPRSAMGKIHRMEVRQAAAEAPLVRG